MLWLAAFVIFIIFQPGVLFAFPPIEHGTVTITTIVVHALFFGVAIALLTQYNKTEEGFQSASCSVATGQNNSNMNQALCNVTANDIDSLLNTQGKIINLQNNLRALKPTDPFYQTYSKSWNIIHPDAALATPQPEAFKDYKEGFIAAGAIAGAAMRGGGGMVQLGGMGITMGIVGCFQNQISCGITNGMFHTGQDCSIQGQYPQQINDGSTPVTS